MCNESDAAVNNALPVSSRMADSDDETIVKSRPAHELEPSTVDATGASKLNNDQISSSVYSTDSKYTSSGTLLLSPSSIGSVLKKDVPEVPTDGQLVEASVKPCGIVRPILQTNDGPNQEQSRTLVSVLNVTDLIAGADIVCQTSSESSHVTGSSPEPERATSVFVDIGLRTADIISPEFLELVPDAVGDALQHCQIQKSILKRSDGETSPTGNQDVFTSPSEQLESTVRSMETMGHHEKKSFAEHFAVKCLDILDVGSILTVVVALTTNASTTSTTCSVVGRVRKSDTTPSERLDQRSDERRATAATPTVVEVGRVGVGLPDGYSRAIKRVPRSTLADEEVLMTVTRRLDQCSFYAGQLTSREAKRRLRPSAVGTFLLRDSSDPRFLYSLTVKTRRGTTSVRIAYDAGVFRLDCEQDQADRMAAFDCVLALVSHYVDESNPRRQRTALKKICDTVFLDRHGNRDLPVVLERAYIMEISSLKHLCRVSINSGLAGRSVDRLWLAPTLKDFIKDYPYTV